MVVHVIHNGEQVGVGINISDEQILSQIEVLNNDFNRLNTDKINTPAAFDALAGSMDIEFVMAKSDPDGLPTTGINRVNGGKSSWSALSDDATLKALSYWPSEDYLNIWITHLSNNYIGYAQFPFSDLDGLQEFQDKAIAETDGLVIDYTAFGVGSSDPAYNLGRTVTHEMGHFFGLRHIWGDESGCSGTDYVNDTPNQAGSTLNLCPSNVRTDACTTSSPGVMYQNFMDYTDDACMNLYTQDQVSRMITVLNNSPRRASLLTSTGLTEPIGLSEDLKIVSLESPAAVTCTSSDINFTIRNIGSPTITSFKFNYKIDANVPVVTDYTDVSIASGETFTISVSINLSEGTHTIYLEVYLPNGVDDANPNNSNTTLNILVNNTSDIVPLIENFENLNSKWVAFNPTGGMLWQQANTNFKKSSYFNAYANGTLGDKSWLVSPILDFSELSEASMLFDLSYGWNGIRNDRLKIVASENCGNSYDLILFDKSGAAMASYYPVFSEWFANDQNDWELQRYINLNPLVGKQNVRIAFLVENRNGNNLFLDNIELFNTASPLQLVSDIKNYTIYWMPSDQDPSKLGADITFNLTERQPVTLSILDLTGKAIYEGTMSNVLNQTFHLPIGLSANELYFVRLHIGSKYYTNKVYLAP